MHHVVHHVLNPDMDIVWALRVVLAGGIVSVAAFVGEYTWRAPWWRNAIGRTLVVKDILLFLLLIPPMLSQFFNFSRLTSQIAGWTDVVLIGLVTPVMIWRIVIWEQMHRENSLPDGDPPAEPQ